MWIHQKLFPNGSMRNNVMHTLRWIRWYREKLNSPLPTELNQHNSLLNCVQSTFLPDFDIETHVRYRMTLANGINGEGMVSFSAVFESGSVQDLGVAFVNLPNYCWAAASCSSSGDVTSLKVFYISGPEGENSPSTEVMYHFHLYLPFQICNMFMVFWYMFC